MKKPALIHAVLLVALSVHAGAVPLSDETPVTSRQGNRFGMIGMTIAILTTLAMRPPIGGFSWLLLILGLGIGGGLGLLGLLRRRRN